MGSHGGPHASAGFESPVALNSVLFLKSRKTLLEKRQQAQFCSPKHEWTTFYASLRERRDGQEPTGRTRADRTGPGHEQAEPRASLVSHPLTGKASADVLNIGKVSQRTDRLLVLYLSYFQTTVTKAFNFYNTLHKKIKFK